MEANIIKLVNNQKKNPILRAFHLFLLGFLFYIIMKNLSGRLERIKQIDIQLYQKFVSGLLTLKECEKILNIKLI